MTRPEVKLKPINQFVLFSRMMDKAKKALSQQVKSVKENGMKTCLFI